MRWKLIFWDVEIVCMLSVCFYPFIPLGESQSWVHTVQSPGEGLWQWLHSCSYCSYFWTSFQSLCSGASLVLLLPGTGELLGHFALSLEPSSRRSMGFSNVINALKTWSLGGKQCHRVCGQTYSRTKLGTGHKCTSVACLLFVLHGVRVLENQTPSLPWGGWLRRQTRLLDRTTKVEMLDALTNSFQEKPETDFCHWSKNLG